MKILFLDDMPARHEIAKRNHPDHEIVSVWTADEAIKALDEQEFDIVTLDHDLSEEHYLSFEPQDYGKGTGMEVVDYIRAMPEDKRPKVVYVHSMNSVMAPKMRDALRTKGIYTRWIIFGPDWRLA